MKEYWGGMRHAQGEMHSQGEVLERDRMKEKGDK